MQLPNYWTDLLTRNQRNWHMQTVILRHVPEILRKIIYIFAFFFDMAEKQVYMSDTYCDFQ